MFCGRCGGIKMKMIIRNDDVGYSEINDLGMFETLDKGVSTSCDVMLESPGTEKVLEKLRNYPWISIGWHSHCWNAPVLGAKNVPSLVIPETGRFRHDLHTAEDVDHGEILDEFRAQIERCIGILGKAPDVCGLDGPPSPFNRAQKQVCEEYGIATGFCNQLDNPAAEPVYAKAQWADRNIYFMDPGIAYKDILTDSIKEQQAYDPVKYYTENRFHIEKFPENAVLVQAWHPGYLDYFVYKEGDYGQGAMMFTAVRVQDVHALCSPELKKWIKENRIELINFRDALYGTKEYQNHLRNIGSDLFVR